MRKRSSKRQDVNQIAASIVAALDASAGKDPLAVLLGRRGGLKGGKARAASLSAQQRSEIARQAAQARWTKRPKDGGGE